MQKQIIMSSFLHIMHYPCFHYYIVITHYYHYCPLLHVTNWATCRCMAVISPLLPPTWTRGQLYLSSCKQAGQQMIPLAANDKRIWQILSILGWASMLFEPRTDSENCQEFASPKWLLHPGSIKASSQQSQSAPGHCFFNCRWAASWALQPSVRTGEESIQHSDFLLVSARQKSSMHMFQHCIYSNSLFTDKGTKQSLTLSFSTWWLLDAAAVI